MSRILMIIALIEVVVLFLIYNAGISTINTVISGSVDYLTNLIIIIFGVSIIFIIILKMNS